jgi:hypothetical protein
MLVKQNACTSTDRCPHPPACPTSITALDDSDLEYVDNYKYLGVWLDCKLSFQTHIKHLHSKIKSRIGFLFRKKSLLHSCCQTYPSKTDYHNDPWLWRCHLQISLQHKIGWGLSQCHPFCHQRPIYYPPLRPVCSRWLALTTHLSPNPLASLASGHLASYSSALFQLTGHHTNTHPLFWPPFLPVLCCQWLEQTVKITEVGDLYLPH